MAKKQPATEATTMVRISQETASQLRRLAYAFGWRDSKPIPQGEVVAKALALLEADARRQGLPLTGDAAPPKKRGR